jgi:hypothetical protein
VLLLGLPLIGCNREDYSTPKKAAKTFYIALMQGDMERARRGLADDKQAAMLGDIRELVKEILAAQELAEAKFGAAGKDVSAGMPSLDELDNAVEKTSGETATVSPSDSSKLGMKLRKIGGQWKVDLLGTLSMESTDIPTACRLVQAATKGVADNKQQIRDGKFRTPNEVDEALISAIRNPIAMSQLMQKVGGFLDGGKVKTQ